mmetsp:Transcript_12173/g.28167  ORF Transcript_12173/g.28167 Transcript_12173/m.28167 type:complete len:124 (+) Transcript_12173:193-564(+)
MILLLYREQQQRRSGAWMSPRKPSNKRETTLSRQRTNQSINLRFDYLSSLSPSQQRGSSEVIVVAYLREIVLSQRVDEIRKGRTLCPSKSDACTGGQLLVEEDSGITYPVTGIAVEEDLDFGF